ncbi:MAG TPA: hypothetical protein VMD06_02065, partial [Steroidobacteraceae bacterium]|nr:hypothetical protein [Steroidobacteraceae bacterium]
MKNSGKGRRPRVAGAYRAALLLSSAILMSLPAGAARAAQVLRETGSTLLYPLFQSWTADYAHV